MSGSSRLSRAMGRSKLLRCSSSLSLSHTHIHTFSGCLCVSPLRGRNAPPAAESRLRAAAAGMDELRSERMVAFMSVGRWLKSGGTRDGLAAAAPSPWPSLAHPGRLAAHRVVQLSGSDRWSGVIRGASTSFSSSPPSSSPRVPRDAPLRSAAAAVAATAANGASNHGVDPFGGASFFCCDYIDQNTVHRTPTSVSHHIDTTFHRARPLRFRESRMHQGDDTTPTHMRRRRRI